MSFLLTVGLGRQATQADFLTRGTARHLVELGLPEVAGEVLGLSPQGIFLSYRSEDAAPYARLLQYELRERIPDTRIFMDLDSIEPGLDFAEVIREAVEGCTIFVALSGVSGPPSPMMRAACGSMTRTITCASRSQTALDQGVRVIPVLVDGAKPLRQQQLPAELSKLARLNAIELSYSRYAYDADVLLSHMQRVLATATENPSDATPQPVPNVTPPVAPSEPQKSPEGTRRDPDRAERLLADAEEVARSITSKDWQVWALVVIAKELTTTDPDRALQLLDEAEPIASSITDIKSKSDMVAMVARNLAPLDPAYAEELAESVPPGPPQVATLAVIARQLASTQPDGAERILRSIAAKSPSSAALADVVKTMASTDPDRALGIAWSIQGGGSKAVAFAVIAKNLTVTDPDRSARLLADAQRLARSMTDGAQKALAFAGIAKELAASDPDRAALVADASRFAGSITNGPSRVETLVSVARVTALTDPERAGQFLRRARRLITRVPVVYPRTTSTVA